MNKLAADENIKQGKVKTRESKPDRKDNVALRFSFLAHKNNSEQKRDNDAGEIEH